MSALLKALGVYLSVIAGLTAWIGGSIWAAHTEQHPAIQGLIFAAPIALYLAAVVIAVVVILPIEALYTHYKERGK